MNACRERRKRAELPVTVVIPCYCCSATLARAIGSVLSQSHLPRQIVLVEDASPDGGATRSAIERFQRILTTIEVVAVWLTRNRGPGHARNAAWAVATQPYVAFLDADDAWHPRKLEIQVGWMRRHPEADLSGTLTRYVRPRDRLPGIDRIPAARKLAPWEVLLSNPFSTSSVVLRRDVRDRFVPDKRYAEDYLLWTSIIAGGGRAYVIEAPLAYLFKRGFGTSGLSAHLWQMHAGIRDCYRRLHLDGRIGPVTHRLLDALAWLKLSRRVVLASLWRLTS